MSIPQPINLTRRVIADNFWLAGPDREAEIGLLSVHELRPEVVDTEEEVGRLMLEELERIAWSKEGDIVLVLLGGRGAQAMHRLLGRRAQRGDPDGLISRLRVFTQDALAPMRMGNSFSFVRDFERLLGSDFFRQLKSFTPMRTDGADLQVDLTRYVEELEALGGIDIFFLGHGPEPGDASHLAYIRPGSGATAMDLAGMIPISPNILSHHITKFKAGGSITSDEDEAECRNVTHILTLGPAAILSAKRIVQSVVDADTAPAKRASFRRVMEMQISEDPDLRAKQLDENPGLWVRLHPSARSLVLPNVLA